MAGGTDESRHSRSSVPAELPDVESLRFGECLGSGHFSHVYEGIYHGQCPAAIKVIEWGSERTGSARRPYIVQLYEVIRTDSTLLVFELLTGLSSDDFYQHVTLFIR
jgi:serine/threonine protein kinase